MIISSLISPFNKVNNGSAFSPFTSIFENWSNVVLYFAVQNSCISLSSPGAWCPNWLQGKSSTSKPLLWYFSYSFSIASYCGVNPHPVAVFTTNDTFPFNFDKSKSSPVLVFTVNSYILVIISP